MKTYTLTECQHMLALTPKQLRRLLADASIVPAKASIDGRKQLLTEEQVTVLLGLQPREAVVVQPGRVLENNIVARLEARVVALERRVVQLEGRRPVERVASLVPDALASGERSSMIIQAGQVGIGKRRAARLAAQHGANSESAVRNWSVWSDAVNLESDAVVLRVIKDYLFGHSASGHWHECSKSDCSCLLL